MIVNHKDSDEYLELLRLDQIPLGLGLDIPLDNHLRFKVGTFNIILGHANVGKTYWVLWYLLALSVKHNLKHLIYSAENSVNGLKRNLIELHAGRKIVGMTPEELWISRSYVESHFDFIDAQKAWQLDEFMQKVQTHGNYDTVMIDPHNSFLRPKGTNAHDYDYEMATKLRLFCKKTKTTVYLCIHAATEALRKTHKSGTYEGLPAPPNMSDAEGGGKWGNRADDFLVLHRYTSHKDDWMYTHVHVKKVKETETGGKPTFAEEPVLFKLENGTKFTCGGWDALREKEQEVTISNNLNKYRSSEEDCPF